MKKKLIMLFLAVVSCTCLAFGLSACTGEAGATGATGATGAAGADGADGSSAYEIAVANGYTGTEAEWLASLTGATGATGVGVSSVELNEFNDIVVTYTNNTSTTLKSHGTKVNPYVISSAMYDAYAYGTSDTYGEVWFLSDDYITIAADETVYVTYYLDCATSLYFGADGIEDGDLAYATSSDGNSYYSMSSADLTSAGCGSVTKGTVVYNNFVITDSDLVYGNTYAFAITNTSDEEITLQTAVGVYNMGSITLNSNVSATLTADAYYATATFTSGTTAGYYTFELYDENWDYDYEYVSVTGYDSEYEYSVVLNRQLDGNYSYTVYLPANTTITLTATMNYAPSSVLSATFTISVSEATINYTITSNGLLKDGTSVSSFTGSNSGTYYAVLVSESNLYKFVVANDNITDIGIGNVFLGVYSTSYEYYFDLTEGELIYICAYGTSNALTITTATPDATLTKTNGLATVSLSANQTYIVYVGRDALNVGDWYTTYTLTITSTETSEAVLNIIDTTGNSNDYTVAGGNLALYSYDGDTGVLVITAAYDCTLTMALKTAS